MPNKSTQIEISDEQIVAYLNQDIDSKINQQINEQIQHDESLKNRIYFWQEALFSLYDQIDEIEVPKKVWNNIEKKLFITKKSKFISHLVPAFLTLFIVFSLGIYLSLKPTYQATISDNSRILWKISGNKKSMEFTSLSDMSAPGKNCIAVLKKVGENKTVVLGQVPDTGDHASQRLNLLDQLNIQAGDQIIIVTAKSSASLSALQPTQNDPYTTLEPI